MKPALRLLVCGLESFPLDAIRLISSVLADAVIEGKQGEQLEDVDAEKTEAEEAQDAEDAANA